MPLLRGETLKTLYEAQLNHSGPFSMLTHLTDNPRGFGRIVRDAGKQVKAVVEEADATPEQLKIQEVNDGIYCFDADWLWSHLDQIPLSAKGEYYLTDLVSMAVQEGWAINALIMEDASEAMGINTRVHLAEAEATMKDRINRELMLSGVTIIDPASTYIHAGVEIERDTIILPNTYIWGKTTIGEECVIGPNTIIESSTIGSQCEIKASVIEFATMENRVDIGPFGHLRKGAHLEDEVHMGNFGEVKNSRLRRGVKMGHFSYIGDGDIGEETNVGAGTITCNYDGKNKHKTITGKNVFIGSDTMLVAPVTLGDGARTGAGSVVNHDIPPHTLAYGVPARPKRKITKDEED
jgi:bifunctional UDP-N-acetylglucosamine pyrophosphorylase/glucosamine-1-phosphate N-acetyltransferase